MIVESIGWEKNKVLLEGKQVETGRQTVIHVELKAALSPQIATSRPISTTESRGSLK